jgi:two-component system sensor histidine kinase MprB
VAGSAAGLDRAISNLLGNALKFSTDGTPIEVKVGNADVVVQNAGPKIPEDDLERVFERFYRVSTSRSLPGSGLGLAIVAAIAAAHGGRAFARNTATGVEMGFTLGTADSDEARNWL